MSARISISTTALVRDGLVLMVHRHPSRRAFRTTGPSSRDTSRVVIADLALERPSCFFEAGLAQGAGLPILLVAPMGTPIHQISSRESVKFYADLVDYEALMRNALVETSKH